MSMSLTSAFDAQQHRIDAIQTRRAQKAIQLADTGLASLAFVILFAQDALQAVVGNTVGVALAGVICVLLVQTASKLAKDSLDAHARHAPSLPRCIRNRTALVE
jgi:hypothetical protein